MKLSEIAIDPDKLENGAWVDDIPEMQGVRLKVRGLGCAEYRKLQARLIEGVPRSKRLKGKIVQDEQDRIMDQCLHRVVLLDWAGLQNEDDTPLAYDKDTALRFLTEPAFRKFRDAVIWAASNVAEDRAEATEVALGN